MKRFLIGICLGFGIWSLGFAQQAEAVEHKWEVGQGTGLTTTEFVVKDARVGINAIRLAIDASGNVGIGTTAPTATLEVNGRIKDKTGYTVIVGTISAYGGTSVPANSGWLLCDGSAVSRTTYADLFAVISTNFGSGDGSTTFNLPDLRGRFLRGVDLPITGRDPDSGARTPMATGGATADAVGSVQLDAFKNHYITLRTGVVNYLDGVTATAGTFTYLTIPAQHNIEASAAPSTSYRLLGDSNGGGNETRPINAYVNYIIKY